MADDSGIKVRPDGPYLVSGVDSLRRTGIERNEHDRPVAWKDRAQVEHRDVYALCRCGASANKPFCDGAHSGIGFDGAETADRAPIADRRRHYGEGDAVLTDDKSLCWHAGFCVREHTMAWDLARKDCDPVEDELLSSMVHNCPSGRLELFRDGDADEPAASAEIAVIDDGPIWVRGGIPIEAADGERLEVRNRVSLCRCGASGNKPFCDNSHVEAGFKDSGSE
jgi:CDGSH-type Zn-finger protein